MIVPSYWAEARRQHRAKGRQTTLRRFGWSDASMADAEAMAVARVEAALADLLAGGKPKRRELKISYNGAEGLPIREEVLSRDGEQVITRNAYGARCLNSPDVLFADVDFPEKPKAGCRDTMLLVGAAVSAGIAFLVHGAFVWTAAAAAAAFLAAWLTACSSRRRAIASFDPETDAKRAVVRFVEEHPAWGIRLYRTPLGLRLIATHRRFDPLEDEVRSFFDAIGVDRIYAFMCFNQRCFRARLTAKPWRIGIGNHLRPRPGVWPIAAEHLPRRAAWVAAYEAEAAGFAACRFVEALGLAPVDPAVQHVVALHDAACSALVLDRPLA